MSGWRDQPVRLLFTWARWLGLRHPTIQFTNGFVPVVAFVFWIAFNWLFPKFNVAGELGLAQQMNGLLQALGPFFVAALALIAGFPGEALDSPMGGLQPYLIVEGERYYPSRRQLLGYLFAYLAGVSIVAYVGAAVAVTAANNHDVARFVLVPSSFRILAATIVKGMYVALLAHFFAVTLLGLHFLGNFLSGSNVSRSAPSPASPPPTQLPTLSQARRVSNPMQLGHGGEQARKRSSG